MYTTEASISVLNSEIDKFGERKVRDMLIRQGYTRKEVLALVPSKKKREKRK